MNRPSGPFGQVIAWAAGIACALSASLAMAGQVTLDTTIVSVAVNGGADVANQGTTCLRVSDPVAASCPGGFVAIPNNNKLLISTALMSKATASKVWLYYLDDGTSQHCPGLVFTPCSVISIMPQ
jgi:hypothetical protein